MSEIFIGILMGLIGALLIGLMLRRRGGFGRPATQVNVHSSIEEMRSLGELSVFKVITKEIVTARNHQFGEFGKKFLEWMLTSKKIALIFEFHINFRYDLRSRDFEIKRTGEGRYRLQMPECKYDTHITSVYFYDEQNSRLMPWLLPEIITRVFGAGFDEDDKNRLIEEAKNQATAQARELVQRLRSDVQSSARETLEALAKGFGAEAIEISFESAELVQTSIDYVAPQNPQDALPQGA